eukprot:contig_8415_g1971
MAHDHGHHQRLRDAFPSANAFKDAIRGDVDDAVLEDGWRKCVMDLEGLSVTTFLCPALDVLLAALRDANEVQYWSGQNGPASPTAMRETPFDGDAFRKNEEAVMTQHGPDSFVLGLHLFSDASHISESGDDLLPANFTFDWAAYRAHFGDTPLEDAVTSMFAEYAVLYGRIAGWITSATPKPTTLQEARDIAHHAEDFVVKLVTPILGAVQTPKIHKLLRHTFDAINLHGNLQNANTGSNETGHKLDKPFYRRTNKTLADFTLQIVRQAQGSRALLKRHAAEDAALESS